MPKVPFVDAAKREFEMTNMFSLEGSVMTVAEYREKVIRECIAILEGRLLLKHTDREFNQGLECGIKCLTELLPKQDKAKELLTEWERHQTETGCANTAYDYTRWLIESGKL